MVAKKIRSNEMEADVAWTVIFSLMLLFSFGSEHLIIDVYKQKQKIITATPIS